MSFKIGLVYDKSRMPVRSNRESVKEDEQKNITRDRVREILKEKYEVLDFEAGEELGYKLKNNKVDMVFNLSTGIRGESRQAQVPAILEMLGIPYIGSGVLAHAIALDKSMAKKAFLFHGINTPKFQVVKGDNFVFDRSLNFPVIVKPACEGSGIGIYKDSLVHNEKELKNQVDKLRSEYNQTILVEEFIIGREFTCGIIGNSDETTVFPLMETDFSDVPEEYGRFNTFEVKSDHWQLAKYYCPADVDEILRSKIEDAAIGAYNALGCRDFSRVDIMVKDNTPYVLEINTLPGLKEGYSDFVRMANKGGIDYASLIYKIINTARKRCAV
ncbi:D-alanine--D-alanine ligase [Oxobacter pfennigii]|uniref:D-alanine--D-alanine ligase n=1 Tax=Oxobacter pfennigii TaxID=36849 RepID=A0A0P9AJD8_9CLOT|nr:ATP-grasp domain-containing protein [Oxobacter pfennigii]KPU45527.1 D-alanine--D-alanine ligase [Oxobacter pfennigii]